jgi:acyl carrier protein
MEYHSINSGTENNTFINDKIKKYLVETFLFEFDDKITETSDLFKLGILDSFGYIQLIQYLEDEFSVTFSEEEMLSNLLVSYSAIVNCVSQKFRG